MLRMFPIYRGLLGSAATGVHLFPLCLLLAFSVTKHPSFAHAKIETHRSPRGVETTYAYNNAGEVSSIGYNDGITGGITLTYDRRGRLQTSAADSTTTTFFYNHAGLMTGEAYSGTSSILNGLGVTNRYDALLRREAVYMPAQETATYHAFGYDSSSRLTNVTDTTYSVGYSYVPNSGLVASVTGNNGGNPVITTTSAYDRLGRRLRMQSAAHAFEYGYNNLNQRTRAAQAEGTYWKYEYDSLGQVTSGKKYWNDGTPVAGQQFEYAFDEIGNRLETGVGGDSAGGGLRYASYTPNGRNGYATRDVPGVIDVYGAVNPAAAVTINSSTNVYRRNEYYHATVTVDNSAGAVYQGITTTATLGTSQSINQNTFVPQSLVTNFYDLDGNLLSDGVWTNLWDAENRLVRTERVASAPAASKLQLRFSYDAQGRRVRKRVYTWNTTSGAYNGAASSETKFIYDGWNLLAELSSNNSVVRSYLWGLDSQGRLHTGSGAGALAVVKVAGVGNYFPLYDGSGNVRGLVDAATGALAAEYDYGAFGENVQATGPAARASPFRYSTKYTDDETGWVYYGFRYYDAETGRWLSEDPLQESGGLNLYAFLGNDPINGEDLLGLILFDDSDSTLLVFIGRMRDPRALWEKIVSGDSLRVARAPTATMC